MKTKTPQGLLRPWGVIHFIQFISTYNLLIGQTGAMPNVAKISLIKP